ncbi:hypothetical protein ACFVWY_02000 [Streptomyces sp. NPDC058195]|uniref:hypothetical protein n=1 Tax=Streptomyces sp. NPDC058195 TaxID=3346375 RepID=UPI0036E4F348
MSTPAPTPGDPATTGPSPRAWHLHHGDRAIARLAVTGSDMPWTYADVEALPGFEEFRPLFAEQERAVDAEDWERAESVCHQIRAALTLTFPDGAPVPEFLLNIRSDGTADWRWHHEPFTAP